MRTPPLRVWSVAVLATTLVHAVLSQEQNPAGSDCGLALDDVSELLDKETRVWKITDDALKEHSLQEIINCTEEHDLISLHILGTIKPQSQIVVRRRLTISGPIGDAESESDESEKVKFTCPESLGLFLIKNASVALRNLVIQGCVMDDPNAAVIQVKACATSEMTHSIELDNVEFRRNRNLNGSVGLTVQDASCYSVMMDDVRFELNQCIQCSQLSSKNLLQDVQLLRNNHKTDGNAPFFCFPEASDTIIDNLSAEENKGTVLRFEGGSLEIHNSSFHRNSGNEEGVIVASTSSISISHSQFVSNDYQKEGAAVSLLNHCTGSFVSNRFRDNKASEGGGIYLENALDINISDSTFESNTAWEIFEKASDRGGGGALRIWSNQQSIQKSIRVSNCSFLANSAPQGGGAISVSGWSDGSIELTHSDFVKNSADYNSGKGFGGALFLRKSHNVTLRVSNSLFQSNEGICGGAAEFQGIYGDVLFSFTRFVNNQTPKLYTHGAGVSILRSLQVTNFTFENCQFEENVANGRGGGLYVDGSDSAIRLINSSFHGNFANFSGGALFVVISQSLMIQNSTFRKNSGFYSGGALSVITASLDVTISQSSFLRNKAGMLGGAMSLGATLYVHGSRFRFNKAVESGGAMYVDGGPFHLKNSSFAHNKAGNGGALYSAGAILINVAKNCRFRQNVAERYGGGIYVAVLEAFYQTNITDSVLSRNKAKIGGGVFFQIDHPREWKRVHVWGTRFVRNFAEVGGGAYFIDTTTVLDTDCNLTATSPSIPKIGFYSSNLKCQNMKGNSVGSGYGRNIATSSAGFTLRVIYANKTSFRVEMGESFNVSNWKSGDALPHFEVSMFDQYRQGPALTRLAVVSSPSSATNAGHRLPGFDRFVSATAKSPQGLIEHPVNIDVSPGVGIISIGSPLVKPGIYTLVIGTESSNSSQKVVINISVRECIVNEESDRNGTLCEACDPNHYNFVVGNGTCTLCPRKVNCTAWGLAPKKHHWIPSPCYPKVMECLSDDACNYKGRRDRLHAFYNSLEPTCDLNETALKTFAELQCSEGYKGLLCGSCSEDHGEFDHNCLRCAGKGWIIVAQLGMIAWTFVAIALAVEGNLTETDSARKLRRTSIGVGPSVWAYYDVRRGSDEPAVPLLSDDSEERADVSAACEVAKRNMTECIKLFLNFAQVCSLAVTINSQWTNLVLVVLGGLKFVGAVSVQTAVSLDCLFPASLSVPRSIVKVTVSVLIPVLVLAAGAVYWSYSLPNRPEMRRRRLILTAVVVLYISYIGWVENLFSVLNCVTIPRGISEEESVSHSYWTKDTSVQCFKGSHQLLLFVLVIPMIVLVTLAFPLASAFYLYWKKAANELDSAGVKEKFGFMYVAYAKHCVFWDCVVMLRKAALALVLVFGSSLRSNVQGLTSVCILIFSLYLQTRLLPYHEDYKTLNSMEIFSHLVCIFTFISGLYFNDPSIGEDGRIVVSVVVVVLIFSFVVYFLFDLYWKVVNYCRMTLDRDGEPARAEERGFKIIVLWVQFRAKRIAAMSRRSLAI